MSVLSGGNTDIDLLLETTRQSLKGQVGRLRRWSSELARSSGRGRGQRSVESSVLTDLVTVSRYFCRQTEFRFGVVNAKQQQYAGHCGGVVGTPWRWFPSRA